MENLIVYLLPPLIGAVIGGVTNDVAIRMLFRPYDAIRIAGWQLPLTPGLIPRERHHIAAAIADTFVAHVFSSEDVTELFLTDGVKQQLQERVGELITRLGGMLEINDTMLTMAKGMATNMLIAEIGKVAEQAGSESDQIKQRIQAKIDNLDVATLEELVLGFSRKQFRHITWFGVLLGALIGVVQVVVFQVLG